MEVGPIELQLGELETRIERLRALYEQYFMGLEKLEPQVPRKDVERRFYLLRKEQIRNTALRFKFQGLVQRYNTLQSHWTKVVREIENGTYRRDIMRAAQRVGEKEALTILGRRRGKQYEGLLAAQRKQKAVREVEDEIEVELNADDLFQEEDAMAAAGAVAALGNPKSPRRIDGVQAPMSQRLAALAAITSPAASRVAGTPEVGPQTPPGGMRSIPPPRPGTGSSVVASVFPRRAPETLSSSSSLNLLDLDFDDVAASAAPAARRGATPPTATLPRGLGLLDAPFDDDAKRPDAVEARTEPTGAAPLRSAAQPPVRGLSVPPGALRDRLSLRPTRALASDADATVPPPDAATRTPIPAAPLRGDTRYPLPASLPPRPPTPGPALVARMSGAAPRLTPLPGTIPAIAAPRTPTFGAAPPPATPSPGATTGSDTARGTLPPSTGRSIAAPPVMRASLHPGAPNTALRAVPAASRPSGDSLPPPPVNAGPSGGLAAQNRAVSMPSNMARPAQAPGVRAPVAAAKPGAPAADGGLSDQRIRQIYAQYVDAKRAASESTAGVTYDKLAESLRAQTAKLHAAHPSRTVDYDVVVKDGKPHLKPVLR